jgi:8-oxo-dGTP pyrophosphatase MutT (NUDIX family)
MDGVPVAREPPFASCIVVWRDGAAGREFLVLHRARFGPNFAGDWAWTPPSGARRPGEEPDAAAARELLEETALDLPLKRIEPLDADVALYLGEAPVGAEVALDAEHDAFRWLPLEEAASLCLPVRVAQGLRHAAAFLS